MSVEVTPGATPEPTPTPATGTTPTAVTPSAPSATLDTAAQIRDLETRNANADARIKELNRENKEYRLLSDVLKTLGATPENLRAQIETLNGELAKWRELAESPEKAKESLETGQAAIQTATKLEREKIVSEAATLRGYKSDVLADLMESKGFSVEVRDIKDAQGKDAKAPFALFKDGDKDVEKSLDEFISEKLPAYLPALKVEATGTAHPKTAGAGAQTVALTPDELKRRKLETSEYPTF